MTARYSNMSREVFAEKRSGSSRFYRSDALGSVSALYDNTQAKTDTKTYWPYGETRTTSGSFGSKNGFVGALGCRTQVNGGIYMRARIEDPEDGRWMTVDPLWPSEAAYVYAASSPVLVADPTGFDPPVRLATCRVFKCRANRFLHHERICVEGPLGGCYGEVFPGWPGEFVIGHGGKRPLPCRQRYFDSTCELISTSCDFAGHVCECTWRVQARGFNYWLGGFCYGYVKNVLCCACGRTQRENRPRYMRDCIDECLRIPIVIA